MLRKPSAIVWFVVLLLIGATSALVLPPNPSMLRELHISAGVYRASTLMLILPYSIIWFTAFYAFEKLNEYSNKVHRSREGEAFKRIAQGVGILAWGLAVPTIISILLGALTVRYPSFEPMRTLLNSYLAMLVSVTSYTIISLGTRRLNEIAKVRPSRGAVQFMILLFTVIGAGYVSLVIHAQDVGHNPYHVPTLVLIMTLVVPHMFSWFVGLYSAFELLLYMRRTSGVLYKHALSFFARGYALVVFASIAVQYITGAYISRTSIQLDQVLVVVYALFVVEATGYALLALAAKRLKRLEEV